jgi:phenylalanyl-tRNA synthetase beta chain
MDVSQSADLVEEIARVTGFDRLPMQSLPGAGTMPRPITTPIQERVRVGRRVMAARGYHEAVTWSFMLRARAEAFGGGADPLVIANPVASDLDCMRPSALANLAQAAQRNADRGAGEVRLFEAGPIYLDDGPKDQRWVIAGLIRPAPARHWSGKQAPPDAYTVKGDLLALLAALDQPPERFSVHPPNAPHWHPGQAGSLRLGPKTTVANFGVLHPRALKALDVEGPVYGFELNLHALPQMKARLTKTRPLIDLPDQTPIRRDFAFLMDAGVPAADVLRLAQSVDKDRIVAASVFDIYTGTGVPEGQKSLAFELVIQPRGSAMTDAEIDTLCKGVIAAVTKGTGGTLRG